MAAQAISELLPDRTWDGRRCRTIMPNGLAEACSWHSAPPPINVGQQVLEKMVPPDRIELSTSPLPRVRSATELWRRAVARVMPHPLPTRKLVSSHAQGSSASHARAG